MRTVVDVEARARHVEAQVVVHEALRSLGLYTTRRERHRHTQQRADTTHKNKTHAGTSTAHTRTATHRTESEHITTVKLRDVSCTV
jgi:hypothetical protein